MNAASAAGAAAPVRPVPMSHPGLSRVRARGRLTLALGAALGFAVFAGIASLNAAGAGSRAVAGAGVISAWAPWGGGLPVGGDRGDRGAVAGGPRESLVLRSDNRGQVLFGRYCDSCHPGGREGLGASLRSAQFKRTFPTPDRVVAVVRRGGFDMPAYSADFLPDGDLAEIAAYVMTLPEEAR